MPEFAATRHWMDHGTTLFEQALASVSDEKLAGPTALPGWTGKHLVAHVAANAEALLNLAHWARTGEETPMYSSPDQRTADIEAGAQQSPAALREWIPRSAAQLAQTLATLTPEQWSHRVRTAQGRDVPATEIPWMRAREVMVHAVDLDPDPDRGLGFADLPEDFLLALIDDIVAKRSGGDSPALTLVADDGESTWTLPGHGEPAELRGPPVGIAAYLAGRPGPELASASGGPPPDLPRWL